MSAPPRKPLTRSDARKAQTRSADDNETKNEEHDEKNAKKTEHSTPDIDENLREELRETFWVQCDEAACRKWRRIIGVEALKRVEAAPLWVCAQHPDPRFRQCWVAEEDVRLFDQLADTVGLVYVKDGLPTGSLVWARLPGYCGWPAVLTGDPGWGGDHLEQDTVGGIFSYHVEFLGRQHSHSWIRAASVSEFIPNQPCPMGEAHRGQASGRGARKRRLPLGLRTARVRSGGQALKEAEVEANTLVDSSLEERLARCQYHAPVSMTTQDASPVKEVPSQSSARERAARPHRQSAPAPCTQAACCHQAGGQVCLPVAKRSVALQTDVTSPAASLKQGRGTACRAVPSTPQSQNGTLAVALQSGLKPHSLLNRTKEERLCLDIEMYRNNERAFEHDVNRLRLRNDLDLVPTPKWSGLPVRPFQIFLAVHTRGGYLQVKRARQWASVYLELTEAKTASGHTVAAFYYRYLYAYELFISGKDYRDVISENRELAHRKKRKRKPVAPAEVLVEEIINRKGKDGSDSPYLEGKLFSTDGSDQSMDDGEITTILEHLDNAEKSTFPGQELSAREKELGLRVAFLEERQAPGTKDPRFQEFLHEEFSLPRPRLTPGEMDQVVPGTALEASSDSAASSQTLLELQSLQTFLHACQQTLEDL